MCESPPKPPRLQRPREPREVRGIDIILTKSISRFVRNTVDLLTSVRELKVLGVAVRFERENVDTHTAEGELLLTLLTSFAQAESDPFNRAELVQGLRVRTTAKSQMRALWIVGRCS